MKREFKVFTALLLSTFVGYVAAAPGDPVQECSVVNMNQINFELIYSMSAGRSVTDLYKDEHKKLMNFAEENKLQYFNITSDDLSVNAKSYIQNVIEVTISFSFESQFDDSLIDKVIYSFSPQNLNFTRIDKAVCFAY